MKLKGTMSYLIRHLVNVILFFLPPTRLFGFRRLCLRASGIAVGRNVSICGGGWIYGRGRVIIGEGSWLSPGVKIYTHVDVEIKISKNCDIGPGVSFITGSHQIGPRRRRAGLGVASSIYVEEGCWIGANSSILGGVTIGSGSIVAAGAVVNKSYPNNVLIAGVPAKFKRVLNS